MAAPLDEKKAAREVSIIRQALANQAEASSSVQGSVRGSVQGSGSRDAAENDLLISTTSEDGAPPLPSKILSTPELMAAAGVPRRQTELDPIQSGNVVPLSRYIMSTPDLDRYAGRFNKPAVPTYQTDIERKMTVEFRAMSTLISEIQINKTAGVSEMADKAKTKTAAEYLAIEYHLQDVDELLDLLHSSRRGLSEAQALQVQKEVGKNAITPPKDNLWLKMLEYFFGGFCSLMWVSSIVCWIAWKPLGDPPDPMNMALAILLMVVICFQAAFTAYQDWSTSQVMSSINSMLPADALVIRDGEKVTIKSEDLVPGDVCCLTLGDKVPADMRLIAVSPDLKFDRSILTGEVMAIQGCVESTDPNYLETKNISLMGTYVTNGNGLGLVLSIGDKTVMGKIARLSMTGKTEKTLLQIEISRFVKIIACCSITTTVITLILWAAWLRTTYPTFLSVSEALVNAIAVLVAFTPEGLPISVAITLTVVARQMFRHNLLCKNLTTVDTLGSISVLASDKTGTLTQNKMFVSNVGFFEADLQTLDLRSQITETNVPLIRGLRLAAGICNDASFNTEDMHLPVAQRRVNGQATDAALLRFAEEVEPLADDAERFDIIFELPFNSKNKFMLKVVSLRLPLGSLDAGTCILLAKGGPDVMFPKCVGAALANGRVAPFESTNALQSFSEKQIAWSSEGKRCLLLAQRVLTPQEFPVGHIESFAMEDIVMTKTNSMIALGLVAIVDPPRPEIKGVIAGCRSAGIRIFMVTGDFSLTAQSIARQIGIITGEKVDTLEDLNAGTANVVDRVLFPKYQDTISSLVLTGPDLTVVDDSQWDIIYSYSEIVFARTTPEQKLKIVAEFKKRDAVVGVTGDGVNDAPALKAANVGIAMGAGSDVAMEAADMVFLDNNFGSIIVAIESGRLVFDNIRKVIVYLLPAGTFAELIPVLMNMILGVPLPLSAFEMICVCLLTDIAPSMSLMYEKPEADILLRPPRNPKKDRLVDFKFMFHVYCVIGLMITVCAHSMFFFFMSYSGGMKFTDLVLCYDKWKDGFHGYTQDELDELLYTGQTVYFVTLVLLQWGSLMCARTRRLSIFQQNPLWGEKSNWRLFGAMLVSLLIAIAIVDIGFLNDIFYTRRIPVKHWCIPVGLALGLLCVDELRKLCVRTWPDSFLARMAW